MRRRAQPRAAEALAAALEPIGSAGSVLCVEWSVAGLPWRSAQATLAELLEGRARTLHDAAILGPVAGDLDVPLRAARERVRAGGVLAIVTPIERKGLRGATGRILSTFDARRRPRPLEEVCAALLAAGVSPVKVAHLRGARGEAVVHGTVIELD